MPAACADEFVRLAAADLMRPEAGQLSDDDLRHVLSAAVRLYAARAEARDEFPVPLTAPEVTATDVAITVSEMIRAVDMNLFDLSMWHGRRRGRTGG
jgi:hypothetical protein